MSRTSLALKSYNTDDDGKQVAIFAATHSTGGARGTILEFYVTLTRAKHHDKWTAAIQFDGCDAKSIRAAIERIGSWVKRAAEALDLENWDENDSIPLGEAAW